MTPRLLLLVVLSALCVCSAAAVAEQFGLFAEQSTEVDGITVRRVRDTTTGVVCYVASGPQMTSSYAIRGRAAAISCVAVPR